MNKIVLGIVIMAVLLGGLGAGFVAGYQDGYSNGCADGEEGLFYTLINKGAIRVIDTNNGYAWQVESGGTRVVGSQTIERICSDAPEMCARNKEMCEWQTQSSMYEEESYDEGIKEGYKGGFDFGAQVGMWSGYIDGFQDGSHGDDPEGMKSFDTLVEEYFNDKDPKWKAVYDDYVASQPKSVCSEAYIGSN